MPSVRSLGPLTMEQVQGAIPSPLPLGQSLLVVWPQLTGLIAATVICFALSYVISVSYTHLIDLINNTDGVTNANLSVSGLPGSWKHEIKSGGWTLSQLSVLSKEKKTFNLKVEVPLKVNKGSYHFTVLDVYKRQVLPLADSSCTIPRIFRFSAGATGMTRRPSRMVGVTSLSTTPSDWAFRRILFSEREMLPIVLASSRRMRANSVEALSLIFP